MSDTHPLRINDQLNNLDNIDSSYDRRKAIDELDQDVTYSVSVVIDKIAENYSYVREDGYRDAYYITGDVSGSAHRVKVLLPTSMNSEVQSWNEGETKVIEATISDWDLAYKQFGLLGRSLIIRETEVAAATLDPAVEAPSAGAPQQDDVAEVEADVKEPESIAPVEEPVEVEADIKEPETVEPAEEPVEVVAAEVVIEEPKPVEEREKEPVEVAADIVEPKDLFESTSENQEIENFLEKMESPTHLEQLAEEHADVEPSGLEDKAPTPTAIPVLDDVPTLKNVPIRAVVPPPKAKRFSSHAPVRPTRIFNQAQEDEAQERTKKIIKITVGICVGIMLLMCVCCGVFSANG
jgi:hypothetical protein